MKALNDYQSVVEAALSKWEAELPSTDLYHPVKYILSLGGKRIRPALTLMAADIFGGNTQDALPAAIGVEVFHNFTLLHDDIMDNAPLRRGRSTVHEQWSTNSAILSGDAMFVLAVREIARSTRNMNQLLELFNKTALEVCEGQQADMDFEKRNDVTLTQYLEMIRLKTAVLLGCALEMGALSVDASPAEAKKLYRFGENLGIAFQIMDDLLDAFSGEEFGKQKGGDILALKKTYLMLKAFEKGGEKTKNTISEIVESPLLDIEKVEKVLAEFNALKVVEDARLAMDFYYKKAVKELDQVNVSDMKKQPLADLAAYLYNRVA